MHFCTQLTRLENFALQNLEKCTFWTVPVFSFTFCFTKCDLGRLAFKCELKLRLSPVPSSLCTWSLYCPSFLPLLGPAMETRNRHISLALLKPPRPPPFLKYPGKRRVPFLVGWYSEPLITKNSVTLRIPVAQCIWRLSHLVFPFLSVRLLIKAMDCFFAAASIWILLSPCKFRRANCPSKWPSHQDLPSLSLSFHFLRLR